MTVLGVYLRGSVYADAALPFRLRSAPKLFFALVDIRHIGHQVRAQVLKLSTTGSLEAVTEHIHGRAFRTS